MQAWSVQPCVRPLSAVDMTAGHNALRGSGPGQKDAFENALARVGCPDRRIDRLCVTCCSPSQPSHNTGWSDAISSRRRHCGPLVVFAPGHHGPGYACDLVGECDGSDFRWPPLQQRGEPGPMFAAVDFSITDDGERAGHEQAAQIAVTLLADTPKSVFTSARVLPWHESNPG